MVPREQPLGSRGRNSKLAGEGSNTDSRGLEVDINDELARVGRVVQRGRGFHTKM